MKRLQYSWIAGYAILQSLVLISLGPVANAQDVTGLPETRIMLENFTPHLQGHRPSRFLVDGNKIVRFDCLDRQPSLFTYSNTLDIRDSKAYNFATQSACSRVNAWINDQRGQKPSIALTVQEDPQNGFNILTRVELIPNQTREAQ